MLPQLYYVLRNYQYYNYWSQELIVSIFVAIVFSVKSIMVNISTREMLLDLFKDKSELISDSWNKMMHLIQEGILSID